MPEFRLSEYPIDPRAARLVRRAVENTPFATMAEQMVGPLAYGIGPDPVAVAKVLNDFAKGNEKFVITGGGMPGQVMSPRDIAALAALPSREELIAKLLGTMPGQLMTAKQIAALASLPSRDELIAKLMGTMQAPVAKLVRTMNEVPAKFVRALAAVRDAKQAA